jgi:RHS repeat-associated protein
MKMGNTHKAQLFIHQESSLLRTRKDHAGSLAFLVRIPFFLFFLTLLLSLLPPLSQAAQNISLGSYTLVSVTQVKKQLYYYNYKAKATNRGALDAYQVTAVLTPEAIKRFHAIDASVSFGTVPAGAGVISNDLFTLSGDNKTPPSNQVLSSKLQWIVSSNNRPVANAGTDQTVQVGETVALNGSASSDVDGDSLTYAWTLLSKPTGSQAVLSSSTAVNPSFLVDKPGDYTLQLIVNDGKIDSNPDSVTISTRNSAPIAQAGPDQTTKVGVAVTLDGSSSSDVDGDPLIYRWTLPVKPSGSQATLSNPNAISPVITPDKPGIYEAELIVNDGLLDSAPDRVTINTENSKPVANAGVDQVVQLGQTVTLDGGTSHDVDGDPLSFKWSLTTSPTDSTATFTDPQLQVTQFIPDKAGLYIAQLIVNDSHIDSDPDTAQITVEVLPPPVNHPPQITSTPVTQATVSQLYQYDVNATDLDGDLLRYSLPLSAANMLIDPVTGLIQWTPTSTGTQPVNVKVDDGQGGSDNQSFNITVSPASSQQVTVPTLIGLTRSAAETAIQQARLVVGTLSFQHDATAASGIVLSQSVASGTSVAPGTAVNLSISLGPDNGLPPDPVAVAPTLDPTVATIPATSTAFLYSGGNPVQTGVAPGTINLQRAAVIRGKVLDKQNNPLPGVTITILNHPEFGQTLSRADGMFDMAVNGGGQLTLKYEKAGYLSAQRQSDVPWQDYALESDVVLIPADAQVTAVDLTSATAIQVARGSVQTDNDGIRQPTLLFPQGTQAEMVMPDGSRQPITTLSVRATEFTVGPNGPQSMPAELPPTSGYTYAVVFTADEAKAAGAKDVVFAQPIPFYVENFLNFPVGETVPLGAYNPDKGVWIASDSGRVVKILSIASGLADLDTDGDGAADNGSSLGITDAERQQLAGLYSAGQSFWRMSIPHFDQTWDANWGFGPPNAAESPLAELLSKLEKFFRELLSNPSCSIGSVIECENQNLGEAIGITGTPWSLHYRSSRAPGYSGAGILDIPLSGATLPPGVKRIQLEITVAGKQFIQSFPVQTNQQTRFQWDGLDVYGRPVYGSAQALVRLGYVYDGVYQSTSRFGYKGNGLIITGSKTRQEVTLWQESRPVLRNALPERALPGWDLSVHHRYDPLGKVLYLGDGTQRSLQSAFSDVISTVAGSDSGPFTPIGDGGAATQAKLDLPLDVTVAADGSFYIADTNNHRIRRVGPDGIITTVAGTGTAGSGGDGGLATQANLSFPYGIAVGPDGSLYIADNGNHRIRRVGPDGIITTIAGTGTAGFQGDEGSALSAELNSPFDVAVGPDGSLYIADYQNGRVRRVGTDGIITTEAAVRTPSSIAVSADGSVYITNTFDARVLRVEPDGTVSTVAGNGSLGSDGDGGLATAASLSFPYGIALGADGSFYISGNDSRIRRVGPEGVITTVAGVDSFGFSGDGGPATQAQLRQPRGLALAPDGNLFLVDYQNNRVRRVSPSLPGVSIGETIIASEDGGELYFFTNAGRHLKTLNALTGNVLYQFTYDSANRLVGITDADGNVTTLERDANGNPTAMMGPFGQRTALSLDASGYLASVTNPASDSYQMTYTAEGLLTSFKNPRGNASTMIYDTLGRLIKDQNAAGGSQNLARTDLADGYEVARSTGLNRTTTYHVEKLSTGEQKRTNRLPDGTQTETVNGTDASQRGTQPDGTITTLLQGSDPRFSMQAPIPKSLTVQTAGLTSTLTTERTAVLADANNPLSLTSLTDTVTLNGRTATSFYNAATKTATATSAAGRISQIALDNLGRVIQSQVTGLLSVNNAYDPKGRLASITQGIGTDQRTLSFAYNPQGYLQTVTDPLDRTVGYEYDFAGRVTRQILPDNREVLYSYDANGNLASLTPPGRTAHVFKYNAIDQTQEYVPPDVAAGTNSTLYEYDLDKALTHITRPDGLTIDFGYDSAGRLSTQTTPEGITGYTYAPTTGKLTTVTAPGGSALNFTYNGALLTQTDWTGEITGNVGFSYDNDFRVTGMSVNGGDTVLYQYDADSLLAQAGDLTLSRSSQNGLLTGTSLGTVSDSLSYDGFGAVTQRDAKFNGTSFFKTDYTYDKLGRITRKVEGIGILSKTYDYGYDLAGRLVEVKLNGATVSAYTYDANGNRLTHTQGGNTDTGTYDAQDRLLTYGSASYTYTANGELKTKTIGSQATSYDYDVLGNLRKVTLPNNQTIDYVIDAANRRVGKEVNGALVQGFLYQDQLKPIAELDGNGAIVSRFVYATRANVPDYMVKGGQTYRIVTDHLGSPRFVLNVVDGSVAQQMDYDEFGNVITDTNPGFQPFGFAGGLYDRDTKLVRFGARDYESETGRWVAKDPILFAGGDLYLYAYAANDPINIIDPFGLNSCPNVVTLPPFHYSWEWRIGNKSDKMTPEEVILLMRKYPNQFFPFLVNRVNGSGDELALGGEYELSPFGVVKNQNIRVTNIEETTFTFVALPGHIAGAGSTITFSSYRDESGDLILRQGADVYSLVDVGLSLPLWLTQAVQLKTAVITKQVINNLQKN